MTTIHDVAHYILTKMGPMNPWKLQKLCYYSQAWSLVWDERPLFPEDFQAWASGPVCPDLYALYKGTWSVGPQDIPGDVTALGADERDTVDVIIRDYGPDTNQDLCDLISNDAPWIIARGPLGVGQRGEEIISKESMLDYYASLEAGARRQKLRTSAFDAAKHLLDLSPEWGLFQSGPVLQTTIDDANTFVGLLFAQKAMNPDSMTLCPVSIAAKHTAVRLEMPCQDHVVHVTFTPGEEGKARFHFYKNGDLLLSGALPHKAAASHLNALVIETQDRRKHVLQSI